MGLGLGSGVRDDRGDRWSRVLPPRRTLTLTPTPTLTPRARLHTSPTSTGGLTLTPTLALTLTLALTPTQTLTLTPTLTSTGGLRLRRTRPQQPAQPTHAQGLEELRRGHGVAAGGDNCRSGRRASRGSRGAVPTARTAHSRMDLRPGVPQAPRVHPQPRLVRHCLERAPCPRPCAAGSLRATTSTLQPFVDESNISGTTLWTLSRL